MTILPFTVHEAEVAVFHAWGDGLPVGGPLPRGLLVPAGEPFRVGLKMGQVEADGGLRSDHGEWRKHRPQRVMAGDWMVEMGSPLGAWSDAAGVQLESFQRAGSPVVVVVRFLDREADVWRVFQFHDCVVLPSDAGDEAQWMQRSIKFSAGHCEEFKSGATPGLVPRIRGVIEWRHLGRCVRCWEYDAEADTWAEDAENVEVVGSGEDAENVRHVSLDFSEDGVAFSYLAAKSVPVTSGGVAGSGIGWIDAETFTVSESSGLTMESGWQVEAEGCAEPVLLPPSGRHWEHPRVVFRVLGRVYATVEAGFFAMPALTEGAPELPLDVPIRLGRLVLYPTGGFVI